MELWDEIESAIAPYKSQNQGATIPFSKAELVTMAIICLVRRRQIQAPKGLIEGWISSNFRSWRFNTSDPRGVNIDDVLDNYEIPLSGGHINTGASGRTLNTFTVPLREGRVFLSSILEPPRKGTFCFLDLPAEIRVRIYEMLFSFPKIMVGAPESGPTKLYVTKREHQVGDNCEDAGEWHHTQPLQRVLAILSTNKQIYFEAVPVFYQINHFRANSTGQLTAWVESVAPTRLQHVRHISFRYALRDGTLPSSLKTALVALSSLKQLKSLEIDAKDPQWFVSSSRRRGVAHPSGTYSDSCDLPGIKELVKLVGVAERVTISGDCSKIKEYVLKETVQMSPPTGKVGTVEGRDDSRARRQRGRLQNKDQRCVASQRPRIRQISFEERLT
jgi:hypothetical protein